MRKILQLAMFTAGLTLASPAFAQWHNQAQTTRIETRPFYGATVTIESGVRVFRGLPPTRHMIINPHGQTPLHLGIEDTRIYEKSESHNHYYDHSRAQPVYGRGFAGAGLGYHPRFGHRKMRQRAGELRHPARRAAPSRRFIPRPSMRGGGGRH